MTDHAKALADALRMSEDVLSRVIKAHGPSPVCELALTQGREALAAYDAHPAEAATRENGLAARLQNLEAYLREVDGNKSADTVKEAIAALKDRK